MGFQKRDRRAVLRGAGKVILSLPLMPSLLSSLGERALALSAESLTPGAFIFARTYYGMMSKWLHPDESGFTIVQNTPPVRVKNMADIANGRLNDHYEDRLRVLGLESYAILPLGLSSHCGSNHNATSVLCASKSVADAENGVPFVNNSSVDVNLAYSNALYPVVPQFRAIRIRPGGGIGSHSRSFSFEFNKTTGTFVTNPFEENMVNAFTAMFGGDFSSQADRMRYRKGIMDAVFEDYKRVKSKVSVADKLVLDQYTQNVQELSQKIEALQSMTCTKPDGPSFDVTGAAEQYYKFAAKMMATAIQCGLTKVVCIDIPHYVELGSSSSTVHGWSHALSPTSDSALAFLASARFSRDTLLKFATELKAIRTADSKDLLYHSLMLHTSEMSWAHHGDGSPPMMMLGSLGGRLNTGRIIDYRMKDANGAWWSRVTGGLNSQHGVFGWVPYNRLLEMILRLGGLTRADYLNAGRQFGELESYSYAVENVRQYHTEQALAQDPPEFKMSA